jgi:hypothetical protein
MGCLARPPSGHGPACWLLTSDAPLSLAGYWPDVSLSRGFLLAFASAGLLLSHGIRLAPTPWRDCPPRGPLEVTPFPVSMARIRRAVLSTGFGGRADRSVSQAAGALSCAVLAPASQPLALVGLHDGSPHLCFRCPSMPARRDTRIEASRVCRLSPLQTVEDQSRAWGICLHSCTWREGLAPS